MKLSSMPLSVDPRTEPAPNGARYHGLRVTPEQYMQLEDDGHRYEMVDGVVCLVPSPAYEHGKCAGRFEFLLNLFLEDTPLGEAVREIDVALPDGGDIVCPDLSFIFNERLSIVRTKIHGAADLVLEVLSPRTRRFDLGKKAERYRACGVREYWLADPRGARLEMWLPVTRLDGSPGWDRRRESLLASRLLAGFQVAASDLFVLR